MFNQSPRRRPRHRGRSLGPALIIESGVWLAFIWWVLNLAPAPTPAPEDRSVSTAVVAEGTTDRRNHSKIGLWIANRSSHPATTHP